MQYTLRHGKFSDFCIANFTISLTLILSFNSIYLWYIPTLNMVPLYGHLTLLRIFKHLREYKHLRAKWLLITGRQTISRTAITSGYSHPVERRRLELKLGHLFKIIHNLCFFPQGVILPREQTPLICSTRSTHSLPLIQHFARTNSYLYSFVPCTYGIILELALTRTC